MSNFRFRIVSGVALGSHQVSPKDANFLNAILQEIDTLVFKGTIVQVTDSPDLGLFPIFVEPTGGEGSLRDPFGVRASVRPSVMP